MFRVRTIPALVAAVLLLVFAPGATAGPAPLNGVGEAELTYACALKSNGLLRAVPNTTSCKKSETLVRFKPGPVLVCVQPSGSTRTTTTLGACRRPALGLTLPPTSGQVYFCVTTTTRAIRYVSDPSQCVAGESPYVVTPNDAAPALVSTSPVTGATQVATNAVVSFLWSEPVTAAAGAITATCGGSPTSGTVGGSGTSTLTFTPGSPLAQGVSCTVTANASLISDADSLDPPDNPVANATTTFTTDTAPTILSTTPASGATGIATDTNLIIVFSEPVTVAGVWVAVTCGNQFFQPTLSVTGAGTDTITVNPDTDLLPGVACTLKVDLTKVHDVDTGDPPDIGTGEPGFSFITADTAPTLVSVSPADGATHVATDANIVMTFSEPVQIPSAGAFSLECGPESLPVGFTVLSLSGATLTIDPAGLLPEGVTCHLTGDAAQITDVDAVDPPDELTANISASFTTDAAPAVSSSTPSDGATGVGTGTTVSVTFSEPVSAAAGALTLACDSIDRPVTISGSGTDTLVATPDSSLPGSSSCALTVHASLISDVDGGDPPDHPAADRTIDFTTVDAPPVVTAVSPADGATGVSRGTTVGVTFSEPVTFDTGAFVLECPTGNAVSLGVTPGGSSATLTPAASLPANTTCRLTVVATKVHDADGVAPETMAQDFTSAFTTSANSAPTDVSLSPTSVPENSSSGTVVGTLTTTDPDVGDTFGYSLVTGAGDADNASFAISGGQLVTSAVFDFETKASYSIRVRSTDGAGATVEKSFTVTVTDVNEAPTDISLSNASIDENQPSGTTVGTLSGVDPDTGQTLTFTLQASGCGGSFGDNASFSITGTTLKSAAGFDFETKKSYTICVRVTDNGSPAKSFDEQFTISVNNVNDPPVAAPQSYTGVVGNTLAVRGTTSSAPNVAITGNLLGVGATDQDAGDTVSVVAEASITSAKDGRASVNADGSFTYLPPAGLKSTTDSFTFHITDGHVQAAGTATMTIGSTLIWYVDNTAAAGGSGRSSAPFSTLTPVNGAGGSGDSDGTGDTIFVFEGSGSYAGGLVLEADQILLGEKAGVGPAGAPIVPAGTTAPVLTNAAGDGLTLANGVQVGGIDITSPSGDGIRGTAITTASVALNSPVVVSGAGGDGVDLTGAAGGAILINASITGSVGRSVVVSGRSGGATSFGAAISGKGIELSGNSGATVAFTGLLTVATTTTPAFSATGGGTVVSTNVDSTLSSTTGRALDVVDTTIGATGFGFKSISADGAPNGIRLSNTGSVGRLGVLGSGSGAVGGDDTGGTIKNTTGAGILLDRTTNPFFRNMSISQTNGNGVSGTGVVGFTFTSGKIAGSGTSGAPGSNIGLNTGGVSGTNVTGAVTVTNNILTTAYVHGLSIANGAGTISSLHVDGNTITSATSTGSTIGNGIALQVSGTAGTAAAVTSGTVANNTVTGFPTGTGISVVAGNESFTAAPAVTFGTAAGASAVAISGNKVSGFSAANPMSGFCISVTVTGRASSFVDVTNNGTVAAPLGLNRGICVNLSVDGAATATSQVTGNVVKPQTQLGGTYGISGGTDKHVYAAGTLDSAVLRANISSNTVSSTTGVGIYFIANSTGTSNLKVQSNNVAAPTDAVSRSGIRVDSGTSAGTAVNTTVCLTISGNTTAGASDGSNISPGITLRKTGTVSTTNTFGITGLPNNPATAAQVETYVTSLNPGSTTGNFGTGGTAANGSNYIPCTMPTF